MHYLETVWAPNKKSILMNSKTSVVLCNTYERYIFALKL